MILHVPETWGPRKTKPDIKINAVSIKFANSIDETPAASKIAEKYNLCLNN